jgi:hypothetical protein
LRCVIINAIILVESCQAYIENKESSNCFKPARVLLFESLWAAQRPIFHVSG